MLLDEEMLLFLFISIHYGFIASADHFHVEAVFIL